MICSRSLNSSTTEFFDAISEDTEDGTNNGVLYGNLDGILLGADSGTIDGNIIGSDDSPSL